MENKDSGIYGIYNLQNGKVYIGQTKNLSKREIKHFVDLAGGYHHNEHLQRAYKLYGKEQFVFEVLELVSDESKLDEMEQRYIDYYKDNLYNISKIVGYPNLGRKLSESHKQKIKIAQVGRKLSEQHIENIRISHRTEEFRNKMRRKCYQETKEKISQKHKKPVAQFDINTNEIINVFLSAKDAAKITGIQSSNISLCCSGKKRMAGGFIWRYADE